MKEQKGRFINDGDYRQDKGYTPDDPEKARLVLKLGELITDRMDAKLLKNMTYDDPEYWALDHILTKDEVKFMLSFKKTRVNYRIEQLAEMNHLSVEDAQKTVDHLVWLGLIDFNRENPEGVKQYDMPIFVPGSAEFMMMQDPLTE